MSENKTAIVFGGAGFIGSYLIRELLKTGDFTRIVCADLKIPAHPLDGVEYEFCDVRTTISLRGEFTNADIYNLAAIHTTPGHEEWEYYWTNLNGALEINAFAEVIGAKCITFTSSISTYGPTEEPRDERGPMTPVLAYGRSKLMAEKIHRAWARADARRKLIVVRPAIVFGPGEHGNFTRLAYALKRRFFVYPGRRDTIKACIYVGEVVRSLLFMRERPEKEIIYNAAYPTAYSSEDICTAFAAVAGYQKPSIVAPKWMMLFVGWGFELLAHIGLTTSVNRARIAKLWNSTNIVPRRLQEIGYVFETDLRTGIIKWREESPSGEFV